MVSVDIENGLVIRSKQGEITSSLITNFLDIHGFEKESEFVNQVADPNKCAEWWDDLFEKIVNEKKTIHRNSSKIRIKFRIWGFLISNRLYVKKLKKIIIGRY